MLRPCSAQVRDPHSTMKKAPVFTKALFSHTSDDT
jgi:hypothetical protein